MAGEIKSAATLAAEYSHKRWGDEPQYRDARVRDEGAWLNGFAAGRESAGALIEALLPLVHRVDRLTSGFVIDEHQRNVAIEDYKIARSALTRFKALAGVGE